MNNHDLMPRWWPYACSIATVLILPYNGWLQWDSGRKDLAGMLFIATPFVALTLLALCWLERAMQGDDLEE